MARSLQFWINLRYKTDCTIAEQTQRQTNQLHSYCSAILIGFFDFAHAKSWGFHDLSSIIDPTPTINSIGIFN